MAFTSSNASVALRVKIPKSNRTSGKELARTWGILSLDFLLTLKMICRGHAVVLSDDGDFLVASNNVIVGKIHGRNIELCKGDKSVPWCSDDIQVGCAVVAASGASLPGPQT